MSPAREELRWLADSYWSLKEQSDNWWIGEYLRCVITNNHRDKEKVLDIVCKLDDDEWAGIKGCMTQPFEAFADEYTDSRRREGEEVRVRVAFDIDLLRNFS